MKTALISFILLVIAITAMTLNAGYVKKTIEEMKSLVTEVCDGDDENKALSELEALWKRNKIILSLSASMRDVDRATEYMLRLASAKASGNKDDIRQLCSLLCNALDDIGRYEKASLSSIL